MSFLSRKQGGRGRRRGKAAIDDTFGDSRLAALKAAEARNDWPGIRDAFASMDGRTRSLAVQQFNDDVEEQPWVRAAMADAPSDPAMYLLVGSWGVTWAWAARGHGWAPDVSEAAFDVFFERLRWAETQLQHAAQLAPDDPVPWAQLLVSGRGLQVPKEELLGRFDLAHERSPWHPIACANVLQAICAKWFGSHEEMEEFSRMVLDEAPAGSAAHVVVPTGVLEKSLYVRDKQGTDQSDEYLMASATAAEVSRAAERSIWHEDFSMDAVGYWTLNHFLMCFLFMQRYTEARRVAEQLDGRFGSHPWVYGGDPAAFVERALGFMEGAGH